MAMRIAVADILIWDNPVYSGRLKTDRIPVKPEPDFPDGRMPGR
jgi:hypothetical protein